MLYLKNQSILFHHSDLILSDTSCIHEDCRRLTELLMHGIEHSTLSNVYCQNFCDPWITAAITNIIKHKHMLYKNLKGEIPFEEFRAYQNKLTSIMRKSKKQYFFDFCNRNKSNAKEIWEQINTLAGHNSNRNHSCTKLTPNEMNNFFENQGPTAVVNLPRATFHYTKYVQPMLNSLHLIEVTENELYSIVSC